MTKLADWLDKKLIPQWRSSWRFSSVQLVTALGTLIATYPDLFIQVLTTMVQHPLARLTAVVGTLVVILIRLWNQQGSDDEQTEG